MNKYKSYYINLEEILMSCTIGKTSDVPIKSNRIISMEDTEILWGGGIIPFSDVSKYACVVGRNVLYKERGEEKEGWEIGKLLFALQTEKKNEHYALLENANLGSKSQFLLCPCPYSRFPVQSNVYDSQGILIDIVSNLEEADDILFRRAEELVARGFSSMHPDVPIRRIVGAPAWASLFI